MEEMDQRIAEFSKKGIQFVRLAMVDTSNIVRIRIIPIAKFLQNIAEVKGFFMSTAILGITVTLDHLVDGLPRMVSCRGEVRLVPDLPNGSDDLRRLPYGSGTHALCMVDLHEKDHPGVPFAGCPRSSLKNILKKASDELGVSFLVGFEIEVYFLEKASDAITPIDTSTYSSSIALHSVRTTAMIDEIVHSISAQGIEVSHFHPESGPGQFEFVLDPYDPLTSADNLVRARETIYNIAAKYDVKATLAPKAFTDFAGSGAHCHISVTESAKGSVSSPGPHAPAGFKSVEESFLAGILKHLRSVVAFSLPNVTSYNRTQDGCWAGAYVCWGIDNREAPLRVAYAPGTDRKFRFEVKSVDGTANPYLAVSAMIVAGLDGIRKHLQLELKELTHAPTEQCELKKLPGSIEAALQNLQEPTEYEMFCSGMGKTLIDIFIAVKKGETKIMRTFSNDEQTKFVVKNF